ncbi:hypothetical protein [Bartonella schoenbuchensis]|uniref:Lipoprotein n=1 Tax=Bartonella schoenbuchensis (strain DSM 13525 / NCTC 13165 / R1) TaxID=687861 RepID=A0A1S6XNF1_BARSR|nr:hypothetical protein [Bartonella schoenbuchensis]AQX30142.1 hypothetical protein BscR1v2_001870 [Bartonella schoenbuchensis R1]
MKKREVKIVLMSTLSVCFILTGCRVPAPTYGTDKAVSLQFVDDIVSLVPSSSTDNNQPVMKQRPELVYPGPDSRAVLPPPQADSVGGSPQVNVKKRRKKYLFRRQAAGEGNVNYQRDLSEPPLIYRQPAKTAPVGQKGYDESVKERKRKRAARQAKSGDKKSLWPF